MDLMALDNLGIDVSPVAVTSSHGPGLTIIPTGSPRGNDTKHCGVFGRDSDISDCGRITACDNLQSILISARLTDDLRFLDADGTLCGNTGTRDTLAWKRGLWAFTILTAMAETRSIFAVSAMDTDVQP
jgi:hypothetical protein